MKSIFFLFAFAFLSIPAFSKGAYGEYFIVGKAYNSKNELLRNKTITIDFRGEKKQISTDRFGNYKITVVWMTACPSKQSAEKTAEQTERMNPRWIWLSCDGIAIKIENQWRKYGGMGAKKEEEITRNLDLKFE
jgi:hypothetical protein